MGKWIFELTLEHSFCFWEIQSRMWIIKEIKTDCKELNSQMKPRVEFLSRNLKNPQSLLKTKQCKGLESQISIIPHENSDK